MLRSASRFRCLASSVSTAFILHLRYHIQLRLRFPTHVLVSSHRRKYSCTVASLQYLFRLIPTPWRGLKRTCPYYLLVIVLHYCTVTSYISAYFFFDGRDDQKELQSIEGLIRSLIRQFSALCGSLPATLTKLFCSCHYGGSQPTSKSLQAALIHILEAFDDVYIVLDALDECTERKDLLQWILEMVSWRKGKLHLLVLEGRCKARQVRVQSFGLIL